jgi:hypothetical protein
MGYEVYFTAITTAATRGRNSGIRETDTKLTDLAFVATSPFRERSDFERSEKFG